MTSQTAIGFTPSTPNSYATPVTVEDATGGLCGARMPNGKGCLAWPNSGGVHFAVVDSTDDFQVDNVVTAGSIGSVVANGSGVVASSVFCLDGDLFVIANARLSNRGTIKLYKANSPTAPTSWSLFTTIQDVASGPDYYFSDPLSAGIPLRLDSGRWVLVQPVYENAPGVIAQAVSAWTSDNAGASFTRRVDYQHQYILNYTTGVAAQTARDPATGYLYFWSGSDAGGVTYGLALWRSTDAGTSWSIVNAPGGAWFYEPHLTSIVDDGSILYAAGVQVDENIWSLSTVADNVNDFVSTGQSWHGPGHSANTKTFKAVVTPGEVYYFWYNRVARTVYSSSVPETPRYHVGY